MSNNITQVAGSYVGTMEAGAMLIRKQTDALIHITDQQTDTILAVISDFWDDTHRKQLDNLETFDFVTFADKPFSEYLTDRNRVIIPGEDGEYFEFIIEENVQRLDRTKAVFANASYLELKKQKVISPQTLNDQTTQTAVTFALSGTEWQPGDITYAGIRTIHIEQHTNSYSLLKQIASEFGLELRFRVEIDYHRVIGRYVDLIERVGEWRGREITFGKDLIGIDRSEKTDQIVTALVGLGPEREDGTRLEVFVEDLDALQRWGRNGRHLVEVYEPQSTDQDMTEDQLRTLIENELKKRINAIVEYETDIADLENVPGMENKKIRFGDTIRIKDEYFSPALYLEARVHTQERSIKDKSRKKVILGDYVEYTEEDVRAIWKSLQDAIAKKVSMSQVMEVTYDKQTIDDKDQSTLDAAQAAAEEVARLESELAETQAKAYADGIVSDEEQARIDAVQQALDEAKADAAQKAQAAENAAKQYTDIEAQPGKDAKDKIDTDVGTGTIETTVGAQGKANSARDQAKQDVANGQVDLPTSRFTGPINAGQNQVQDGSGVAVVKNEGVLSTFAFISSGQYSGWQECGWWGYGMGDAKVDVWRRAYFRFRIPVNFTLVDAALYVYSMPRYVYGFPGITNDYYHTRYIHLYQLYRNYTDNSYLDWPYSSEYEIITRSGSARDVSTSVWGSSRWDPDIESDKDKIKVIGGKITDILYEGYNEFYVQTESAINDERNASLIQFVAIIKGYQN